MAKRKLSLLRFFDTKDPLNVDLLDRAKCIHPKLKPFQLVVSGRDWCNLYEERVRNRLSIAKNRL